METQSIAQQPLAASQSATEIAGVTFSRRFWAYLIDLVVFYITNIVFGFVGGIVAAIFLTLATGGIANPPHALPDWFSWVSGILVSTFYFGVYEWLFGATLGKIVLKLRVVRRDGEPCGLIARCALASPISGPPVM